MESGKQSSVLGRNRYLQIAQALKDMARRHKNREDAEHIQNFLIRYLQAPHFVVEIDPQISIAEMAEDQQGFEEFFAFPYREFVLDFPPLPNVRGGNFAPFLFCRLLDAETLYVQGFDDLRTADEEVWVRAVFDQETMRGDIAILPWEKKVALFRKIKEETPLNTEMYLMHAEDGDWKGHGHVKVAWSTYGNLTCSFNEDTSRSIIYPAEESDVPPYFHICPYQREGRRSAMRKSQSFFCG